MPEVTPHLKATDCLDFSEDCNGGVEYRHPLSATGRSFPRCDFHWELRLDKHEADLEKDRQYRQVDWLDAGETYEED